MAKKTQKIVSQPPLKKPDYKIKKIKMRVIGIGGGGSNIVSELSQRVKKASFLVANTDVQALKEVSRKTTRFLFGRELTKGLGTGMNTEIAEIAAQKEIENIKKILAGQDLCVLAASLGGGVGSGAVPVFAKVAKSLNILTLGVFTFPFQFEGEERMGIAKNALYKIKPYLNAISVIPNEKVFQVIDKNTPLKNALSAINKMLAESLEGLIETVYAPGLINIDFADVKAILEGRGKWAYLTTVKIDKRENLVQETVKKLLNNPFYPYDLQGAKGIILNIVGPANLRLLEVGQIAKAISVLLDKEAKIILGISHKNKHPETVETTILATGCKTKILSPTSGKTKRQKSVLPSLLKKRIKKTKKKEVKIKVGTPKIQRKKSKTETKPKSPLPPLFSQPLGKSEEQKEKTEKIRKNALEVKKEIEEAEKEMLAKEQVWEAPAFLRKKKII